MHARLPPAAAALGIAGLIPFIGLGIGTIAVVSPAAADRYLYALVGYGAVILAFLGGVHWGFVLHPGTPPQGLSPDERRDATRLGLGVLPSLIGWAALLTPAFAIPDVGLAVLIAGYLAVVVGEHHMRQRGLMMPSGYMTLRWVFSIIVLAVLVTVLAVRLLGARIIF